MYAQNPTVPTFIERKEKQAGKSKMIRVHKLTPTEEIEAHKERFYQEVLILAQKLRVEKKYLGLYLYRAAYRLKQDSEKNGDKGTESNP